MFINKNDLYILSFGEVGFMKKKSDRFPHNKCEKQPDFMPLLLYDFNVKSGKKPIGFSCVR